MILTTALIKRLVIRWAIGFIFDTFIESAEYLANRSDTSWDNGKFVKFGKGLL
jgi:hypothetical protein